MKPHTPRRMTLKEDMRQDTIKHSRPFRDWWLSQPEDIRRMCPHGAISFMESAYNAGHSHTIKATRNGVVRTVATTQPALQRWLNDSDTGADLPVGLLQTLNLLHGQWRDTRERIEVCDRRIAEHAKQDRMLARPRLSTQRRTHPLTTKLTRQARAAGEVPVERIVIRQHEKPVAEKVKIGNAELWHGDCLEVMTGLPDGSVDMVLADIPYGVVNRASGGLRAGRL